MKQKKAKTKVKEYGFLKVNPALSDAIAGNEDLLIEVLLRAPAKSLVKFKCVCKQWLTLISDPKFCHHHSARSPKNASAIYYYKLLWCGLKSISLNGHRILPSFPSFHACNGFQGVLIEDSCNGLMLCSRKPFLEEFYFVCNLTTNKYTVILEATHHTNRILLACLAYDPAKSPYYKVLLARHINIIDIYFSENNSWKRIEVTKILTDSQNKVFSKHKVFWDGSFNWIHSPKTHLKFDVDNETLTEITLPAKLSFLLNAMIRYFGKVGNNLILIQYRRRATQGFRILEMKKGGTCWNVKQRVNLRPIMHLYPTNKEFHVVSVLKGSCERDVVLVVAAAFNIFTCNLSCKKLKVICDFTPFEFAELRDRRDGISSRAYHFMESLAPV